MALWTLLLSGITEKGVRTGSLTGTAAGELGNIDSAFSLAFTFSSISLVLVPASLGGGVRYATQTEMQYRFNARLLGVSYISSVLHRLIYGLAWRRVMEGTKTIVS